MMSKRISEPFLLHRDGFEKKNGQLLFNRLIQFSKIFCLTHFRSMGRTGPMNFIYFFPYLRYVSAYAQIAVFSGSKI